MPEGGAGIGARVSADDLQNLERNPEAVDVYRKAGAKGLLSYDPEMNLTEQARVALERGRTDMAKEFSGQAKDVREERKSDLAERKQDQTETYQKGLIERQMKQVDAQIASANAAAKKADKHNTDADTRNRSAALQAALRENGDQIIKLRTLAASADIEPAQKQIYEEQVSKIERQSKAISSTLINYGNTGKLEEAKQAAPLDINKYKIGGGTATASPKVNKPKTIQDTGKPIPSDMKSLTSELLELDKKMKTQFGQDTPENRARLNALTKARNAQMSNR